MPDPQPAFSADVQQILYRVGVSLTSILETTDTGTVTVYVNAKTLSMETKRQEQAMKRDQTPFERAQRANQPERKGWQ